jgi:hypothetical protein
MVCPYCGSGVRFSDRSVLVNKNSSSKLANVYVCAKYPTCDAYVGCETGTDIPLGTLANEELRKYRMEAHKAFDWMWTSGRVTRTKAYGIMQKVMELTEETAHIGMMDIEQCQQVIEIFGEYKKIVLPFKAPKSV